MIAIITIINKALRSEVLFQEELGEVEAFTRSVLKCTRGQKARTRQRQFLK